MKSDLKKFAYLFKRRWYIQSFNSTPNLLTMGAMSGIEGCKKYLGYGYTHFLNFYKNGFGTMYYDRDDLHHIAHQLFAKVKKNPKYLELLVQRSDRLTKQAYKFFRRIDSLRLDQLPTPELIGLYHQAYDYYVKPISISHIIEGFTLTADIKIKNQLFKELERQNKGQDFNKVFNVLTQPIRPTFFHEMIEALSDVIKEINKQKLSKIFKLSNREIIKYLCQQPKLKGMIYGLQENFFWMHNNYSGAKVLTINYFLNEVKTGIKDGLSYYKNIFKQNKKAKDKAVQKYGFGRGFVKMFKMSDIMSYWQDDRKKFFLIAIHYLDELLKEIGDRFNLPISLMRYALPQEIWAADLAKLNKIELSGRQHGCLVIGLSKKIKIFSGSDYKIFKKQLAGQEKKDDQKELNGLCASVGKAVGRVTICRTVRDIAQFRAGDILVAPMTRPEFVPAMKKALAIVTDEGGITSHAAIISRELGKPCVIGTKIATATLKNGDYVEVNANHGVVKIMK